MSLQVAESGAWFIPCISSSPWNASEAFSTRACYWDGINCCPITACRFLCLLYISSWKKHALSYYLSAHSVFLTNQSCGLDGRADKEALLSRLLRHSRCYLKLFSTTDFLSVVLIFILRHRQYTGSSESWKGWKPLTTWWFTPRFSLGTSAWKKSFKKLKLQCDASFSCRSEVLAWKRLQKEWRIFFKELNGLVTPNGLTRRYRDCPI